MSGWVIVGAIGVVLALLVIFLPIRLRFSFQGRAEPSGAWAIAGGAQLGPAAGSGVAARGIETTMQAHLFGRPIWKRTLRELREERKLKREEADAEADVRALRERLERTLERAQSRYRRLERWFDPVDLVLFLVRERRRLMVERVVVDLDYSFYDIALTGKLLGTIYAFSALLPAAVTIRQNPSWEGIDRMSMAGSGKIRIRPGLLVVDAAWFLIRNVRVRRRLPRSPREHPGPRAEST